MEPALSEDDFAQETIFQTNGQFSEIQHAFHDILQDLRDIGGDGNPDLGSCSCCAAATAQISQLKDETAFLAKRILLLLSSQEDIQQKLQVLLADNSSSRTASNLQDTIRSKTSDNSLAKPAHVVPLRSFEDSGCHSSSSEEASFEYETSPASATVKAYMDSLPQDDTGSESTLSSPRSSVQATGKPLTQKLIHVEVEYAQVLGSVVEGLLQTFQGEREDLRLIEKIYLRHTILWQELTSSLATDEALFHARTQAVIHTLLKFWCKQENIQAYIALFRGCVPKDNCSRIERTTPSLIASQVAWKHIHFLSIYLRGVNDALVRNDVHLEQVLSSFAYLLQEASPYSTGALNALDVKCRKSVADFSTMLQKPPCNSCERSTQTASGIPELRECHGFRVEFMEGMSFVTKLDKSTEAYSKQANSVSQMPVLSMQRSTRYLDVFHENITPDGARFRKRQLSDNTLRHELLELNVGRRNSWRDDWRYWIKRPRKPSCVSLQ